MLEEVLKQGKNKLVCKLEMGYSMLEENVVCLAVAMDNDKDRHVTGGVP